jgi:SAM-dependent methyltransferase
MPPEAEWETYFDPCGIVTALECGVSGDVIEFGCGYGSFTIAAAQRVAGTVYALDIDPLMVEATARRVARANLKNVVVEQRDFVEDGCGRPDASASLAMLFNILHIEDPVSLLREANRALRVGGVAAVIHWSEQAGLRWLASPDLTGSPWHWGLLLQRGCVTRHIGHVTLV